jgi:hypothetical protein
MAMAKLTVEKAGARKARAKAIRYRTRSRASDPGIAIVGLKEGGLGWQVTDEKGAALKPNFGRVLTRADISMDSPEYQASSRAIDKTFQALADRMRRSLVVKEPADFRVRAHKVRRIMPSGRALKTLEAKAPRRDLRGSLEELD